ncbi:CSAD-like protein [Mya arenaria]|uniref:CSAD-like protein n=1 Tax=Mya arenaria TaxID=6604 RepID=A0ABY7E5F2_MYAAR|nr:CSAD-like protein [Mya arenaria]
MLYIKPCLRGVAGVHLPFPICSIASHTHTYEVSLAFTSQYLYILVLPVTRTSHTYEVSLAFISQYLYILVLPVTRTSHTYEVSPAFTSQYLYILVLPVTRTSHTYEVSPAFVLLEQYLMQKICGIVGYPDGDGIFCPGGSMVNIMAMNLARYRKCPEFKTHGMYAMKHLKYYTSEEGALPTFVMATSGTTVLGAYDNLADIADVCQELDVWLHCDACWGGGALLSPSLKYLMDGIHRTDSMAWNFHKMSAAPLQCSVLVLKQKGLLEDCNRFRAEYLFQPDKNYNTEYDIAL